MMDFYEQFAMSKFASQMDRQNAIDQDWQRLKAELESATKDAERYRWMKSEGKCMRVDTFKDNYRIVDASVDLVVTDWFKSFDEAIDAAMKG